MAVKLVYLKDLSPAPKAAKRKKKAARLKAAKKSRTTKHAVVRKGHKAKSSPITVLKAEPLAIGSKVVLDIKGGRYRLQTLDARSHTFGQDFGAAFKKSVKKARRENTRVIGRPDIAIAK